MERDAPPDSRVEQQVGHAVGPQVHVGEADGDDAAGRLLEHQEGLVPAALGLAQQDTGRGV